ncbi:hypothetical protein C8R43DRAFT_13214 [Mycena crocata]|nr:hypothetical protein C8R43DRAFT_13214 [Mycena crocata]
MAATSCHPPRWILHASNIFLLLNVTVIVQDPSLPSCLSSTSPQRSLTGSSFPLQPLNTHQSTYSIYVIRHRAVYNDRGGLAR